jgi:inorganic pyrophosphatase
MTAAIYPLKYYLPDTFSFYELIDNKLVAKITCTNNGAFYCVICGLWSGFLIGWVTEIYTSNAYTPVQELAEACRMGSAPNIILGLALGYMSTIIPILCLGVTIYVSFTEADLYGIALSALGMLGCLPIALAIDGYGPISDNAGGIAEMTGLDPSVR